MLPEPVLPNEETKKDGSTADDIADSMKGVLGGLFGGGGKK